MLQYKDQMTSQNGFNSQWSSSAYPAKDSYLVGEFGVSRTHHQGFSFRYEVSVDSLICCRKNKSSSFLRKEILSIYMFQSWQAPSLLCKKAADLHLASSATTSPQPSILQRAQDQNRRSRTLLRFQEGEQRQLKMKQIKKMVMAGVTAPAYISDWQKTTCQTMI